MIQEFVSNNFDEYESLMKTPKIPSQKIRLWQKMNKKLFCFIRLYKIMGN